MSWVEPLYMRLLMGLGPGDADIRFVFAYRQYAQLQDCIKKISNQSQS